MIQLVSKATQHKILPVYQKGSLVAVEDPRCLLSAVVHLLYTAQAWCDPHWGVEAEAVVWPEWAG